MDEFDLPPSQSHPETSDGAIAVQDDEPDWRTDPDGYDAWAAREFAPRYGVVDEPAFQQCLHGDFRRIAELTDVQRARVMKLRDEPPLFEPEGSPPWPEWRWNPEYDPWDDEALSDEEVEEIRAGEIAAALTVVFFGPAPHPKMRRILTNEELEALPEEPERTREKIIAEHQEFWREEELTDQEVAEALKDLEALLEEASSYAEPAPAGAGSDEASPVKTARVGPADTYFEDGKFNPPLLAEDIAADLRLTRGPGGGLWYYASGVFRPGAENLVADIVRRVLKEKYRANRLNEVMSWCKTLPIEISTEPVEGVLNVANGVLELDTLTLRPVRDSERFTYQIPVAWRSDARCPQIETFVREVVPRDCVPLMAEIIGLCLLATSRYRRAVMLLGPGSNGKSVLLRVIKSLLGSENVSSVTLQALSEDHFAKAQLFGKLANVAGDLDSRPVEHSGPFKMLTGEDTVTADHKYGQPFQFVNYATLIFSANEWPVSHDQTDAYFTRWIAVPFNQRYREDGGELRPGEKRADPKLGGRLVAREELEGLLVRAVAGALRLQNRGGFDIPESARKAVADYRQWADTVMAWIDDAVTPSPSMKVSRRDVYRLYGDWCKENGRSSVSTKKFWPRFREVLADKGVEFDEVKSDGNWTLIGLYAAP